MDTNIQKYAAFVKAVEYGSFTKAAAALNYTQSGISRMIADIEKEGNITLLERGKGGVKLTSEGEKIFPLAQKLVADFEKMSAETRDISNGLTGVIKIAVFSSAGSRWLPNILKKFVADYPNIEYEFILADRSEAEALLSLGKIDCAFVSMPFDKKFKYDMLFCENDKLMAVLPPDSPLISKEKIELDDLKNHPFILLQKESKAEIARILEKAGVNLSAKFTTWDDYTVMSMVEKGLGISILPNLILQKTPYNIAVKELSFNSYRKIGFAVNSQSVSAVTKKFCDYLHYRNEL